MFRKIFFSHTSRQRLSLLITALLILPFAIFFTANARFSPSGPGSAAGRVFGESISWDTFTRQRAWLRQRWEGQLAGREWPEMLDAVLDQQTWDMLALLHEAKRRRVQVGDDELAAVITQIAAFQDQGTFRRDRYDRMLQAMNTTPQTFEGLVRNDILLQKLLAMVRNAVSVDDAEVRQAFDEATEQRRATLMLFEASGYAPAIARAVTDEDVRAYYDQHGDAFRIPAQLTIDYAGASREALRPKVTVTDTEVRDYYDAHADEFTETAKNAPKPFDDVRDQATQAAIDARVNKQLTALALDLEDDVAAGQRFEEIAQARALIVKTAGPVPSDGSALGELPPEVFHAVVSRTEAELSDVIRAEAGVYLARIAKTVPSVVPPYESVKAQARDALLRQRARDAARDAAFGYAETLRAAMQEGLRFEEAVLRAGPAPVVHSSTFTRTSEIPPLGSAPMVNQAGFNAPLGQLSQVLELPTGYALLRPETRLAPDATVYEKTRDTWREQALEAKRSTQLETWLADVRKRAKITSWVTRDEPKAPAPESG